MPSPDARLDFRYAQFVSRRSSLKIADEKGAILFEGIDRVEIEENFDDSEIDNAKAFPVDFISDSGPFSWLDEGPDSGSLKDS